MKFSKTVLTSGLRVVTVPMKDTPTATVLVMVEAGSNYESNEINGISHFLEHMCFKGTTKRPKSIDISRELDGIGAGYNAFTSNELTGYYAKAKADHLPKILDVVSDIYLNSVFDANEKEKGVIIEEMNMYKDMPHAHVHDLWNELLYRGQPAGRKIIGTKETVTGLSRDNFADYRKKHYLPSSTIVVVAGNINETDVLKMVEEKFKGMASGKKTGKVEVTEVQKEPNTLSEFKETDQVHLVLGFRSLDIFDKRQPILDVLSTILGEGMSSRLFEKLREEMGVCYYVRSRHDDYTDYGSLKVSAGVDVKRMEQAISAILAEFKKLKESPVSKEELEKAKEYFVGTMYLGLESSDSVAEFYGFQETVKGKMKKPEEIAKEIKAVSAEDVHALANEIFKNESLNLALIGPVKDENNLLNILRI